MRVTWAQVKEMLDGRQLSAQWIEIENSYLVIAIDGGIRLECLIDKSPTDTTELDDFEENYKEFGNQSPVSQVGTKFERDDIVLKLARIKGQADSNGDVVLDMIVPGDPGAITRYAAGGYAYVDNYSWDDALTKCEVVDVDNIFGFGAGAVLKNYHDQDVSEENRGWFFEKSFGSEGNLDIEPLGWYGALRGGLTLRLTFKVQALAKVKCIIWWGALEE